MVDSPEIAGSPRKKHRHDLGQEDHGAKLVAGVTRGVQSLLGLWIALTIAFVIYAMVDGARGAPSPAPAPVPAQVTPP